MKDGISLIIIYENIVLRFREDDEKEGGEERKCVLDFKWCNEDCDESEGLKKFLGFELLIQSICYEISVWHSSNVNDKFQLFQVFRPQNHLKPHSRSKIDTKFIIKIFIESPKVLRAWRQLIERCAICATTIVLSLVNLCLKHTCIAANVQYETKLSMQRTFFFFFFSIHSHLLHKIFHTRYRFIFQQPEIAKARNHCSDSIY